MMPQSPNENLAKFVDVFLRSRCFFRNRVLHDIGAALEHGFAVRAHLGQLSSPTEGFIESMLECCQPTSLDHMDHVRDHEVAALAKSDTVVTFVPGANYFLDWEQYPPARKFIDSGVAVALATDYNPGNVADRQHADGDVVGVHAHENVTRRGDLLPQRLTGLGHWSRRSQGTLEPGKDADLAVFDVRDYREIPYWFG